MAINALLVEDDPHLRGVMKEVLESAGYCVCVARDGQEALASMRQFEPDVIISDILMPRMDGLELIRWIRRELRLDVPIVAMTGERDDYAHGIYLKSARTIGADMILQKPFRVQKLLQAVERLLAERELQAGVISSGAAPLPRT